MERERGYFQGAPPLKLMSAPSWTSRAHVSKRPSKAEKCAENVAQTRYPEACAVSCAISAGGREGKDRRFLAHNRNHHNHQSLPCPLRFVISCKSLRFHLKSRINTGIILIEQKSGGKKISLR